MANQYELPVLCFCADVIRSSQLRRDFDQDPYALMALYGMDEDAMEVVYTMFSALPGTNVATWKALSDYIWDKEMKPFVFEPLLPLPSDPDCKGAAFYPNPEPKLWEFNPKTGPAGSNNVPVVVKGMGLWKVTEVFLRLGANRHKVLSGTPVGTYRCSHLAGMLDLSTVPAGTYEVLARNVATTVGNQREFEHQTKFVVT